MSEEETSTGFDYTDDDFDYSDLEPYEAEAEEHEEAKDDVIVKLTKNQRKLAERQARIEAQAKREKLLSDFYATASDTAKELADVLIAGVSDPDRVKKMLELAEAKAAQIESAASKESEDSAEEGEAEKAFAPPLAVSPPEVNDRGKETKEKTRRGDPAAAWLEFLAAPTGPQERP